MNKLKEDIEKWNQILRNYAGVKIKTNGLGVGARYSFNLFDSLYQHEILGLKDIKEFRDISTVVDTKFDPPTKNDPPEKWSTEEKKFIW